MQQWPFVIPKELDLVEFTEPIESDPNDGYWCFEATRGLYCYTSVDIP